MKKLILIFFLLLFSIDSFAQVLVPDQRVERENLLNQQRIEQERQSIIREKERAETDKVLKSHQPKEVEEKRSEIDKGGCIVLKEITISGNTVFSNSTLKKKFFNQHQGQCLKKFDIEKIRSDLTNFYIDKGYSNARL